MADRRIPARALLLVPGGFALLAGLDAALVLLGLPAPVDATRLAEVHGILLVLGFVGTVVALERAVAAHRGWAYLSPMFLGAGAVLLVTPAPRNLGGVLLLAGSAVLVAVYVPLWRRSADVAVLVQVAGAVGLGSTRLLEPLPQGVLVTAIHRACATAAGGRVRSRQLLACESDKRELVYLASPLLVKAHAALR